MEGKSEKFLKDYTPPEYLIDTVQLTFEIEEQRTLVTNQMAFHLNQSFYTKGTAFVLQGDPSIKIISVTWNDEVVNAERYQLDGEKLLFPHGLDDGVLTVVTEIYPHKNTQLMGLYRSNGHYFTQCEAEGFRRMTYFLDRPDVLASYTTKIIADRAKYPVLLSNGNPIESGHLGDSLHYVVWEDPFKKPCYLFALVAGNFEKITDHHRTSSGRDVILEIYAESENITRCDFAMFALKKSMEWDELRYGREYDLDRFMIVGANDFNFGAMENKGLNIFNSKYILADALTATDLDYDNIFRIVAHEYFHNWSGNRVTCRDWFQLSLKEGFTVFREQQFCEEEGEGAIARIDSVKKLRQAQFTEDAGPLSHPVQPESYLEINNFYTATIYEKGAEIIRMLHCILGERAFRQATDLYFERFDGQAVTIQDFVRCMEDVSGLSLQQFQQWYKHRGTPHLYIRGFFDEAAKRFTLYLKQSEPNHPENTGPLHIPVRLTLMNKSGQVVVPEHLIQLKTDSVEQNYEGLEQCPIPSLMANFAAPVHCEYDYTDSELVTLAKYDSDSFNRWDAGQRIFMRDLTHCAQSYIDRLPLERNDNTQHFIEYLLLDSTINTSLLAYMLAPPSEQMIAEQLPVIHPNAVHVARDFFLTQYGHASSKLLEACYSKLHTSDWGGYSDRHSMNRRRAKNVCLEWLGNLGGNWCGVIREQFRDSQTMTDTLAALAALSRSENAFFDELLMQFYECWHSNVLVMDKWFAIQAHMNFGDVFERVRNLTTHKDFNDKNPNKIYALIGNFTRNNPYHFHMHGETAYLWLTDWVKKTDAVNPMVAARIVEPLTHWRRFAMEQQTAMRAALEGLLGHKLSANLFEVVKKSVG